MTTAVLCFPDKVQLCDFFFPFLSLLEKLIIMQVRFLYLLVWLRAVFCGTAEVLCFCSHLLLENAHEVS